MLCGDERWSVMHENDIDLQPDELGRELGEAFAASLRPAILNRDGATFYPAEFAQSLEESGRQLVLRRRCGRPQEPDGRQLAGLLRARHERPRGSRAAKQRDELAAPHSITSSARASNVAGRSSPSAFAVVRLMVRSNLVGCSTGMSAGLAPRRTLSINSALRRNVSGKFVP